MRRSIVFTLVLSLSFAIFIGMTAIPACSNGAEAAPSPEVEQSEAAPSPEAAQPVIEEKATLLLKQMSDFLASQDSAKVHLESLTQVIYPSGLKLHTDRSADLAVDRPDRLRFNMCNAERCVDLYYDGKTATVYTPAQNYYATFDAPPTISEFISKAQDKYEIDMPVVDVLRKDSYNTLMQRVQAAAYIGQNMVRGVKTNHLAFRRDDMDYEIWIQDGAQPLPRRLVIVDKSQPGSPVFAATFTDWELSPSFASDYFTFVPPEGASKIAFIQDTAPPSGAGPQQ